VANGFYAAVELNPYPLVWQGGQIAVITVTSQKCGSLKGQCHDIFECWFFNPIASPGPMKGRYSWTILISAEYLIKRRSL
jgi:hypothetical protein